MERLVKHLLVPAIAPAAIVGLYFTPVGLIGCVNRGLIALAIAVASLVAGIVVGLVGIRARRDDPESRWWFIVTLLILALPALLILGPLG